MTTDFVVYSYDQAFTALHRFLIGSKTVPSLARLAMNLSLTTV